MGARTGVKQTSEVSEDFGSLVTNLRDAFGPPLTANRVMGNLGGIVASRLAREFDVGGPCFTISSDETSGLHALHTAIRSLQLEEVDRALVGAVDLPSDIRQLLTRDPGMAIPGLPFGDGALAFVLKRLTDAERDGDRVYAVIRETSEVSKTSEVWNAEIASDIGHCGAATGLAAVLKSTLSLYHCLLPSRDPQSHASPEFWLKDCAAGPRRIPIDCGSASFVLEEAESRSPRNEIEHRQPLGACPARTLCVRGKHRRRDRLRCR